MRANPSPQVIGHRGAPGYRPEHTSGAYELAFALGADAVEPDIVATKDGVLVLRHENEISTTTDIARHPEFADRRSRKRIDGVEVEGWFTEDFTWSELSSLRSVERLATSRQASASFDGMYPIMRLRDLFELVNRRSDEEARLLGVVAELKHATHFESIGLPLDELFAAELSESGWAHNPALVVESFEKSVLAKLYRRGYRGKRVYLIEASGAPADRVAADGENAVPYSEDVTQFGLYALGASDPVDRVDGISVAKSMILAGRAAALRDGDREQDGDSDGDDEPADEHDEPADDQDGADDGGVGNSVDDDGIVDVELVDQAHAAGLEVYCWTLRAENRFLLQRHRRGDDQAHFGDWLGEFRAIMQTGVDGVFADQPDLAVIARNTI